MSFSDAWENIILKHRFNILAIATHELYVGLSSADPLDDASGLSEPASGKGYLRCKTTNASSTSWQVSDATGVTVNNSTGVTFPTATKDWGTMTHFVLFSGATSGASVLASAALSSSKEVTTGDVARFLAQQMNLCLK